MQSWDLQRKIQVTTTRIIEWYEYFGGSVYVAFSGGKDSTVLLDIVRRIYPDVPAVFCDTGLEFPEIREFVKQHDNVVILRPEMNFRKVIETYGYPVVSKRVADTVEYGSKPGSYRWKELHGEIIRSNGTPSEFIAVFKIKAHIHMNETTLNSQKGKHSERRVESHWEEHPVTLP